jgi:putative endonuclease
MTTWTCRPAPCGAWTREHQMKEWRRAWKLELIERFNLTWRDLFEDLN